MNSMEAASIGKKHGLTVLETSEEKAVLMTKDKTHKITVYDSKYGGSCQIVGPSGKRTVEKVSSKHLEYEFDAILNPVIEIPISDTALEILRKAGISIYDVVGTRKDGGISVRDAERAVKALNQ